jgi:Anti-sigma-K factor rskA
MNPQLHDEFVALCALFYSGEISEEDWALLQIHMAYCESCRERFSQYQTITSDVIPAMAAVAASDVQGPPGGSSRSIDEAEQRLMSHIDSVSKESRREPKPSWHRPAALIAACALGVACGAALHLAHTKMKSPTPSLASSHDSVPLAARTIPEVDLRSELARSQKEITALHQQLSAAEDRFKQTVVTTADFEKQFQADEIVRKQLSEQKEALSQRLASTQTEVETLHNELTAANASTSQQGEKTAALEAKIRELNSALDEKDVALNDKDRMLALDKDFLAHDRDIRELIGARDLYIADIFDTTQNGKAAKQFGRIFYTKDRSLVFYGFDLDKQAGLKRDASFQAWGSGSNRPPVSLGLFYQDDKDKRWVLRCNDAKTLARLDMVFVTVEPSGGSSKPTGKQLLRAYLQIPPNHP